MAALPPYSTFRTDNKQMMYPQATSHGNILTFTPPGFTQQLNVKFPDSRLAVCAKCKKNFKTRDMCRVRNTHTTAPWTTAYICITIDESCLDENGKLNPDKPMTVRMVQWQPYCVRKPFDSKTPVCSACKRTNRTRSFCRERHKHRQLPWCTVFVLLSALDSTDPTTVVAGSSVKVDEEDENTNKDDAKNEAATENDNNAEGEDKKKGDKEDSPAKSTKGDEGSPEKKAGDADGKNTPSKLPPSLIKGKSDNGSVEGEGAETVGSDSGDDIADITASRTFLAKVSSRSTTIHWLDMADFDSNETQGASEDAQQQQMQGGTMMPMPPYMDPNQPMHPQFYQPNMGYAAQQHQNALKSRQQYFFQMQQQHPGMHSPYPPHPSLPPWGPPLGNPYSPHHMGPQPPSQPADAGGEGASPGGGQQQQQQQEEGTGSDQQKQKQNPPPSHHHMPPHGMHPPPPHWPMYYPPPGAHYPPPPGMPASEMPNGQMVSHHHLPHPYMGPPPPGAPMPPQPYHNQPESAVEESDEQDVKRQRVT